MTPHIEWETLEFYHNPKSADWYWAVGIISVTAVAVAFIFNEIIFAIFLFVAGFAVGIHGWVKPNSTYYAITNKGIVIGNSMHQYADLECFWVDDLKHIQHLHPSISSQILLMSKKSMLPVFSIPMHKEMEAEEAREHLLNYLPEKEIRESFFQKLMEKLGF
ncbi:MAG: hypothetical protein NTV72_01735 [Candidatus Taylorbacteria bacterium]|nr:hypothetical protein [Candidatus Taylorbacteria bacterium]